MSATKPIVPTNQANIPGMVQAIMFGLATAAITVAIKNIQVIKVIIIYLGFILAPPSTNHIAKRYHQTLPSEHLMESLGVQIKCMEQK
jgi:hypothetical protein